MYGMTFGGFELTERINRGSLSEVYRARSTASGRPAAVRLLLPELRGNPTAVRQFMRGARLEARCDHPNVVRVFEIGEARDTPFVATELIEGDNLKRFIIEKREVLRTRPVPILRAVGEALAHLHHAQHMIHRDVKPENVLVSEDGKDVRLADFSLAVEKHREFLYSRRISGSPSYIAPERLLLRRYDERVDIYSLGILAYEVLALRLPYTGSTEQEIMRAHTDFRLKPEPIRRYNPNVSPALEHAVFLSLEKDLEKRYPDVRLFVRDIRQSASS
ncbi:MAG: serine/threonine protein kinase [Verrucomicrobia bacterium]|nr:serine/threonine protein kinase [Verrucomicrobiota bacterium]